MYGAVLGCKGVLGASRDSRGLLGDVGSVRGPFWVVRGIRGVRGVLGVASGLGAQPNWAPVQGPSTTTGSPGE